MSAQTIAERRWLLQLLGPEKLADARPLTDAEAARMGNLLDRLVPALTASPAGSAAFDDQVETVIGRLIAEASR